VPNAEQLVSDIQRAMAGGDPARDLKERLWDSCLDVVHRLASRYTRSASSSREDFMGEGYLKFEQALQTFDPEAGVPFRGYLSTCVDRHFNDRVRKRREQTVPDLAEPADDSADPAESRLMGEEVAEQVEAVLRELLPDDPRRQRKILAFRLRHLDGWSVEEIRHFLREERANTVSQWIHRVRKAFAEAFPRRYPDYFGDLELDSKRQFSSHD
jgi:RNA polymerase sigma factor (sigma-70 family)